MANVETEKIIQDILLKQLGLPADYGKDESGFIVPSVYIFAPNVSIGSTDQLQICIQAINTRIIANNSCTTEHNGQLIDVCEVILNEMIQIDIFSRNNDARLRRFEVLTALRSAYAKQKQEEYNIKIFEIPNGVNTLNISEGSSKIYRYAITFNVMSKRQYCNSIDYYDRFRINAYPNDLKNESTIV